MLKSESMNRDYELTILLKPTLEAKDADKEVKSLVSVIEKAGAEVVKKNDPEKKQMAYEIAKFTEAFYVYFELKMDSLKVIELETKLKLQDNIIRYLLVKKGE